MKFKFGGKRVMNFKIKVGNVHDTIEHTLIPELITTNKKWALVTKMLRSIYVSKCYLQPIISTLT